MKKLLFVALLAVAAGFLWNKLSTGGGDDALADLRHRLDAAESSFQQAGRAAGMSGVDTTSDAGAALAEVADVERELRELDRSTSSAEEKRTIEGLLARAAELKRRMG